MLPAMEIVSSGEKLLYLLNKFVCFSAISQNLHGHQCAYQRLRQDATDKLRDIDFRGTADHKEALEYLIISALPNQHDWVQKCAESISRYATRFTEPDCSYSGAPEAHALARHLNRTIVIISTPSEGNINIIFMD
jgi:hypothetical protein